MRNICKLSPFPNFVNEKDKISFELNWIFISQVMAMRLGKNYSNIFICIGDVMDSMLTLSLVDSGFESRSGQVM